MPLTDSELKQYFDDGFVIVDRLFDERELAPVIQSIEQKVDRLAERLVRSGKIPHAFKEEGFLTRLTKMNDAYPGAATLLHTSGVLPKSFADLWSSPKLLDILEQMLGPEIAGHPVWNLRCKTPINALATVPWHQDTAYLASGSEHTFQPTAWIPLVNATSVNGCMQVVRGGHRSGRVLPHHLENTRGDKNSWYLYIDEADLPAGAVVTCEIPKGSVLFLNNLLPHRSTENYSSEIRWSIDLRWQRPGEITGMEGIKDCILMRTAANPDFKPDWKGWSTASRQVGLRDVLEDPNPIKDEDSIVGGPWMTRWQRELT